MFDPQLIVDPFMQSRPVFSKDYVYSGLWKPSEQNNQIVVIFQKRVKWSGLAGKLTGVSATTQQKKELKRAFDKIDTNKDGSVSREELRGILKGLGEAFSDQAVDDMIKKADINGDGKIQFEEFLQAL